MRGIPVILMMVLASLGRTPAQELLFDGTFDDWTFGFEGTPWDPYGIAQVQPNGELHFYADGYDQMGMRTNEKYGNYELTLEYKWLTSAYHGNSGIWIHGQDDWAIDNGAFPTSIEVQLWKRHAGDLLRKGLELDPEPGYPSEGETVYRRTENGIEEHLYDIWNTITIRCEGDTILVWLNGYFINRGINVNRNGTPVREGYITLQAEWFNIAFRNITITHLVPDTAAALPEIAPDGGTYEETVDVTLSCETNGAAIHYTTDGSVPDSTAAQYSSAFTLTSSATVRAVAYKDGLYLSPVASASFTVTRDTVGPVLNNAYGKTSTTVMAAFDSELDAVTAADEGNYVVDNGVSVTAAVLQSDGKSVLLTVTPALTEGVAYALNVSDVEDTYGNAVLPGTARSFALGSYTLSLSFSTGSGDSVFDGSGNGNNGAVGSAAWAADGKIGSALAFDGNDTLTLGTSDLGVGTSGAFTAAVWFKAAGSFAGNLFSRGLDAHPFSIGADGTKVQYGVRVDGDDTVIEAEDMTLAGYAVDAAAMSGAGIRISSANSTGTATTVWSGSAGTYDVEFKIVPEFDGAPTARFLVNGSEVWAGTYPSEAGHTDLQNDRLTLTAYNVDLAPGDTLVYEGTSTSDAFARVDNIEFVSTNTFLTGTVAVTADEWRHAVLTYGDGVRTLYVDGAVDASDSLGGELSAGDGYALQVGAGFTGLIDEVKAYDRALSAAEVAALYGAEVPVEMTSFTAQKTGGSVVLAWATASEQGNLGWHVYRSVDDGAFTRISATMVSGQGTTAVPQQYAYTDSTVPDGIISAAYYLVQHDVDGGSARSYTVRVTFATSGMNGPGLANTAVVVTNPFRNELRISVPGGAAHTVEVVAVDGRRIYSGVVADGSVAFDTGAWQAGAYWYRVYGITCGTVNGVVVKAE